MRAFQRLIELLQCRLTRSAGRVGGIECLPALRENALNAIPPTGWLGRNPGLTDLTLDQSLGDHGQIAWPIAGLRRKSVKRKGQRTRVNGLKDLQSRFYAWEPLALARSQQPKHCERAVLPRRAFADGFATDRALLQ